MAQLVHYINCQSSRKLDELNVYKWHHAMREALPIDLFKGWTHTLTEGYKPSSFESLMGWIALESVIVRATWTIVRIYEKDKILELKRK